MKQHPLALELRQYAENALFLDTETTGLSPDDEIIEIAIIDVHGNTLINTTLKPAHPYADNSEAALLHGIRYDDVRQSPTWADVQPQILSILYGRPLLIYNADFDIRMMNQTARIHRLPEIDYQASCLMKLYSQWHALRSKTGHTRHRLAQAAAYCGLRVQNEHRALDDCQTTLGIFRHMLHNSSDLLAADDYKMRTKRAKTTANPNGHLFGQTVVITGDLSMPRAEIQQMAADAGCRCTTSVSPKTTILVIGTPDLAAIKGPMSSKELRARELREAGHPIQILSEAEFMQLLNR